MDQNGQLPALPLVGRVPELALVRAALDAGENGHGSTIVFSGASGIGKSRLAAAARDEAEQRGWTCAEGRANPVERGVPYSLFSDALLPTLRRMSPESRNILTRGGREFTYLFPELGPSGTVQADATPEATDFKGRLLWNFTGVMRKLAALGPRLIILEDLQWADASSLEMFHFLARQTRTDRIIFICTYNTDAPEPNPAFNAVEQSLISLGVAHVERVAELDYPATLQLIARTFTVDEESVRGFAALIYGWTRGNAFFVEETLKALVARGRLYQSSKRWLGWELEQLEMPRSVRDAVLMRASRLSPTARTVLDHASVIGMRVLSTVLSAVLPIDQAEWVAAIAELRLGFLTETLEQNDIVYHFVHPILRETIYGELGLTRTRLLHATVARAVESTFGAAATDRADALAYHFARAGSRDTAEKAFTYSLSAGRAALAKYANREAADYFASALERIEAGEVTADSRMTMDVIEALAQARQRCGEYDVALALLQRARSSAGERSDDQRAAVIERRIGLAHFWSGRFETALEHFAAALELARTLGDTTLEPRIRIARAVCLQEMGRPAEARLEAATALETTDARDFDTLARIHRTLLQLHIWTGPPAVAHEHGARAAELAARAADPGLAFSIHWALAVLGGFTANSALLDEHLAEAQRIAEDLGSPLLRAWCAEIAIEMVAARGDSEAAIAIGEQAVAIARALNQHGLLPRLLVWTGLVYLSCDEISKGKSLIDEAWERSTAGHHTDRRAYVQTIVPAHIGRAVYHLAIGEYAEAIRVAEVGLELVDSSGYAAWGIYRLLPTIVESYLWLYDFAGARRTSERLRADSTRFGHPLGLAWADACDAIIERFTGNAEASTTMFRRAAEALEAVPNIPDATRLRRQLAGHLAETGDRDGALRELRDIHSVLVRLGAARELDKAREQFRNMGSRPPARAPRAGAEGITGRELEIARLIAKRNSNKAIAHALHLSPRTVSTHVTNILRKLELKSRAELVDHIRSGVPGTERD